MVENTLLKLNDLLSKKETEAYSITGTTKDGTFRCQIIPEANFKEDVTHYVYQKPFTGWSYFPNLDNSNNKFIYWKYESVKGAMSWIQYSITFQTGSYQIENYNKAVQSAMMLNNHKGEKLLIPRSDAEIKADPKEENAICIFVYIPTSRIMIRVKKGYRVGFIEGTWYKELGFNKDTILAEGLHTAPNSADLMKTFKIRI